MDQRIGRSGKNDGICLGNEGVAVDAKVVVVFVLHRSSNDQTMPGRSR